MSKVSIDDVSQILKLAKVEPAVVRQVIEQLNHKAAEQAADRGAEGPKPKSQFVVLACDPSGAPVSSELVSWVFQTEEGMSPATIIDRIKNAATSFNTSRKGRKSPVSTLGETIQHVPRKFWKTDDPAVKTLVKSKEPLQVVVTSGKL